jgi:hypothetical protein
MIIKIRDDWYNFFLAPIWVSRKIGATINWKKVKIGIITFLEVAILLAWLVGIFITFMWFGGLLWDGKWFTAFAVFWLGLGFFWFAIEFIDKNGQAIGLYCPPEEK